MISPRSTIAAELGDPRRFADARRAHGLRRPGARPSTPAGPNDAQAAITKTGNAHLRRVLVEAAWHYRHHPVRRSPRLRARQRRRPGRPSLPSAWAAQQRLHRRYQRLAARGKPKQHIVTAVARELHRLLSGRRLTQ